MTPPHVDQKVRANAEQNIAKVRTLLQQWNGASGQMWGYLVSHSMLMIRVYRDPARNLFIWCGDCDGIEFPKTHWADVNLRIENVDAGERFDRYRLVDAGRCKVDCGLIRAEESEELLSLYRSRQPT